MCVRTGFPMVYYHGKILIALFVSLVNYILVLDLVKTDRSPGFFFHNHKKTKSFALPILLLFN